jgi:hypothetical protein
MSVYHAIHPSPYADDCPDCAGYPEPIDEPTRWGWPSSSWSSVSRPGRSCGQ